MTVDLFGDRSTQDTRNIVRRRMGIICKCTSTYGEGDSSVRTPFVDPGAFSAPFP
jgi:hypothetical protein